MSTENAVAALIRGHGGQVLPFRNLSVETQLAIAHYMGVDGEAWLLPPRLRTFWDDPSDTRAKWRQIFRESLPWYVRRYGREKFGYVVLPMADVVQLVWTSEDFPRDRFRTFDAWNEHRMTYEMENRGQPAGETSVWPIVLDTSEEPGHEPIQDGWHRLNQYYALRMESVPAVYYP